VHLAGDDGREDNFVFSGAGASHRETFVSIGTAAGREEKFVPLGAGSGHGETFVFFGGDAGRGGSASPRRYPRRESPASVHLDASAPRQLLAVDFGLRTGLAAFGPDGRLRWYRSQHFGSTARLRRGVPALLDGVSHLVVEGGGSLARVWADEAAARGVEVRWVSAETWRAAFLYPREQRSGERAKRTADELARRVIEWSTAPRPTSLRHDAAEAILVGLWGVLELGWLAALPPGLLHARP
jgi:hypothetical protein